MTHVHKPLDWKECEYLSLANAARIAGRSATWARAAVCTGDLESVRLPTGGPEVVTVRSVQALLSRSRLIQKTETARGRPRAGHLTLVTP